MGKPPKHRVQNSRVTPKGTRPQGEKIVSSSQVYSGPTHKVSPPWVPALMFSLSASAGS